MELQESRQAHSTLCSSQVEGQSQPTAPYRITMKKNFYYTYLYYKYIILQVFIVLWLAAVIQS